MYFSISDQAYNKNTKIIILIKKIINVIKWRPPNLSELTQMIFNTGLANLGSEAFKSVFLK